MNPENLLKERFKHYEIKHTKKKQKKPLQYYLYKWKEQGLEAPERPLLHVPVQQRCGIQQTILQHVTHDRLFPNLYV